MEKYYNDTHFSGYKGFGKNPRNHFWKRFFSVFVIAVFSLLFLVIVFFIGISLYFTPERLSKIASSKASEFLNSDVRINGLDYSFFSSFPELYITVDSIRVTTSCLDSVSPDIKHRLPENADLLVATGKLHAGINIRKLLKGDVVFSEIEIDRPLANIVIVNDSLNNFNIFPPVPKDMKMPDISFGKISLGGPFSLNFTDLRKELSLSSEIDLLDIEKDKDGFYDIDLDLKSTFSTPLLSLEKPLRTIMSGKLGVDPHPLALQTRDLKIALEPLALTLNTEILQKETEFMAESFDLQIEIPDLLGLIDYIPSQFEADIKPLENVSGNIPLSFELILYEPYQFPDSLPANINPSLLPDLTLSIQSKDGNFFYTPSKGEHLEIENLGFVAEARFNKQNPEENFIRISDLSLYSEGIDFSANTVVSSPFSAEQEVKGTLRLDTHLEKSLNPMLSTMGLKLKGKLVARSDFSFEVTGLDSGNPQEICLENIAINGEFISSLLSLSGGKKYSSGQLKGLDGKFSVTVPSGKGSAWNFKDGEISVKMSDLLLSSEGIKIAGNGLDLVLSGDKSFHAGKNYEGDLSVSVNSLDITSSDAVLNISGLKTNVSAALLTVPKSFTAILDTIPAGKNDIILRQRVDATPMYLLPSTPAILAATLAMADADVRLSIDAGRFSTPNYLATNLFSDLNISTDLNDISIKNLNLKSDNTSMSLSGSVKNLAPFLCAGSPSLLSTDLDIRFDNVDINRLAGAYYGAVEKITGKPYDFTMPPQGPYTKADSICVLIPRNLKGNIRLTAKSAEYMAYQFSPLSTEIVLENGNATLKQLTIGAPYCTAIVDWTYSTASLDSIYMSFAARVKDFEFTPFFRAFPQLTETTPEITNLSGRLNLDMTAGFGMFPSMFMETPSLWAKFNLTGDKMYFERKGKIEKITHLMMIKGAAPIKIDNLSIMGSFHDNLLIINPFHLGFDNYQLGFAGVNNLRGDMYYHLALEKSPFHLPFGVNIVGSFSHPEVRFGGTEVKDSREREISAILGKKLNVNIMTNLHRGWIMFVEEAAKYDLKNYYRSK